MSRLNYHHLHYFWAVARNGNLTRAAEQLHVSPSALSAQIRQLEEQLGQELFSRQGRTLELTEAGRIALAYAENIFAGGNELLATLREGRQRTRQVIRIGAVATLSRNFQEAFVEPLLWRDDIELILQSGNLSDLLLRLGAHNLDLVLSNRRVHADVQHPWRCQRIARQQVSLVGRPQGAGKRFSFPSDLRDLPLLLPGPESEIRAGFDLLCEERELRIQVLAEVDDMATLRVLAKAAPAAAVVPRVVVRDELRSGVLEEYCALPNLYEDFFAISVKRQFQHHLLKELLARSGADMLTAGFGEPTVSN